MPQLRAIRRFEEWKKDPANIEVFFAHIEGTCPDGKRKRLRDACMAMKLPYMLLYRFIHDGAELQTRYELTLKAMSDKYMQETIPIADDVKPVRDEVAKAKLQIEARQAYASKLDAERYGDKQNVKVNVAHWVMRLPAPAANTTEWQQSIKNLNPAPIPALAEVEQAPDAEPA